MGIFGRKRTTPVEECVHVDHPDAAHWHYGYGNRYFSYDGPVRDDFSDDTTKFAKGAELEESRNL
jgi:hypothetical protein